jgi:uncharacterized protein YdeI (YjbR/CyaY-like superfamily)
LNKRQDLPVISFADREDWERWLEEHHTSSDGLWLKIAKQGSDIASISYAEALEAALCYGWIDSQKAKFDAEHWLQRFTPRRSGGKWSKANRDKAEELIARGLMKPAGLQEVEWARADGRWDAAYAGQRSMAIPDDLRLALEKNERAREFFATLDSRNRYAILYRIQTARKPETRAQRIEKFITMLSEHEKIYS